MSVRIERVLGLAVALLWADACPAPRLPEGPSPEYEAPRVPPWDAGTVDAAPEKAAAFDHQQVPGDAGMGDAESTDGSPH